MLAQLPSLWADQCRAAAAEPWLCKSGVLNDLLRVMKQD
jgi:hypothetical protein